MGIPGDRGILIIHRQVAVQRQDDEPAAVPVAHGLDGAIDFIGARHEDQRIAIEPPVEFLGGNLPNRHIADGAGEIFQVNRERAPLRFEDGAGRQVFLHAGDIQRRGHHHDEQIGPARFLDLQRAGEGDVAVEMALVKFVKKDGRNAGEIRIGEHLSEQDALGDIPNPGAR